MQEALVTLPHGLPLGVEIPNRVFVGGLPYNVRPALTVPYTFVHAANTVSFLLSSSRTAMLDDGTADEGIFLAVWERERL